MKTGLYIHIPFCLKKCGYCAFYSSTDLGQMDGFVSSLLNEIELYRGFGPFDTVYFGGGTPSLLNIPQLQRIIERVRKTFSIAEDAEWTIETNPGDLDRDYCRGLKAQGFNRINIGIQSLSDPVLSLLGRRHDRKAALAAVESARSAGFENMGLDLIYAVPGQDLKACLETLAEMTALSPEHLSCYQLTIEEGTPISDQYLRGVYSKPDDETEAEYFMKISDVLTASGYVHYEVSNYARNPDLRSRHNMKYWDHTPYLGLGPAAHSFDGQRRWWNLKSVEDYCVRLNQGNKPVAATETLTREDLRLETLSLGLRTSRGISLECYKEQYHADFMEEKSALLKGILGEGLAVIKDGFLHPTRKGMAVADALARELAF